MGFCSLQHSRSRRFCWCGPKPARWDPPSGFGHPLDGSRPSNPCPPCFMRAALMGFTLRSLLLSGGARMFPSERTHVPFLPPVFPAPKRRAGPAGRGFWALALPRVPCGRGHCLPPRSPDAPLGFAPSRVLRRQPRPGSAGTPLTRLVDSDGKPAGAVLRLRVSIGCRLAPSFVDAKRRERTGRPS
jgi:hypothetical protein